jgi:hypothetical protein
MSVSNSNVYYKRLPGTVNNVGVEIDTREYVFNSDSSISSHFNFMVGIRKNYNSSLTSQSNTAYTSSNSAYPISITSLYEYVRGYLYRDNYIANDPTFKYGLSGSPIYKLRVITIPLNELKEDRIKPGTFGMNSDTNARFTFNKYLELNNSPNYNYGIGAGYVLLSDESWLCCDVSERLDHVHTTGYNSSFTVELVFSPKEIKEITTQPYRQFLLYRPRLVDRMNPLMVSDMNFPLSAKMFDYTYAVSAIPSFYSYDEEINNKYTAFVPNLKTGYDHSVTSDNDCAMAIIMVYYPPVTSITASLSGIALSGCTTFQIVRNGQMYGEYLVLSSSITAGITGGTSGATTLFDNNWHQLVWTFKDDGSSLPFNDENYVYLDAVKLPNLNPAYKNSAGYITSNTYSAGRSITTAWYQNNFLKAPTVMTLGAKLQVIDQQLTTRNTVIQSALQTDVRYLYRQKQFEGVYGLQVYDSQREIDYGIPIGGGGIPLGFSKSTILNSTTSDTQIYSFFGASELEKYLSAYYGAEAIPEKNPDIYVPITDIDTKKMKCTDIVKDLGCFGFNGKIAGFWLYHNFFDDAFGPGGGTSVPEGQCIPYRVDYPSELYPFFYGNLNNQTLKFIEPLKRTWAYSIPTLIGNFCFWKDEKDSLVVNNRLDFRESAQYSQKGLRFNKFGEEYNKYYGAGLLTKPGTNYPNINLVDYYEFYDTPINVFTNNHLKHGKIIQNTNPTIYKEANYEVGVIFYDLGIVVLDGSNIFINYHNSMTDDNISTPIQWSVSGYDFSITGNQFIIQSIKFQTENFKYVNYMNIKLEQDEGNTSTNPTVGILNNLTYPTTIGLYNDNDELLFIAKSNHKMQKTNYYGIRYNVKIAY